MEKVIKGIKIIFAWFGFTSSGKGHFTTLGTTLERENFGQVATKTNFSFPPLKPLKPLKFVTSYDNGVYKTYFRL